MAALLSNAVALKPPLQEEMDAVKAKMAPVNAFILRVAKAQADDVGEAYDSTYNALLDELNQLEAM